MKRIIFLLPLCLLVLSCSKYYGEPMTQEFALGSSYSKIDISNGFDVTVSDEVDNVVITVGEEVMDRVVVKVNNNTLIIDFKWGTNYWGDATAIIPAGVAVDEIDLSGGSILAGVALYGADADLSLSGGSKYTGSADVSELEINMSGGSEATLTGISQQSMDIELSGGSILSAYGLMIPEVEGDMSGGSVAHVTCCTSLEVNLSGGSELTYGVTDATCRPMVYCPASGGSTVKPR